MVAADAAVLSTQVSTLRALVGDIIRAVLATEEQSTPEDKLGLLGAKG